MPQIRYYRTWCKKCKEWELHTREFTKPHDLICKKCGTIFTEIPIVEIPVEKVKEQRERYKEMNLNHARGFVTGMYLGVGFVPEVMDIFSRTDDNVVITESDAGQHAADERRNKARAKLREEEMIFVSVALERNLRSVV